MREKNSSKIKDKLFRLLKIFTNRTFYFIGVNSILIFAIAVFVTLDVKGIFCFSLSAEWQVVCQIITTLIFAIVTVISISLSIQRDEIFGVKGTDFYKMRTMPYFSFYFIILFSIFFTATSLVCLVLNLGSALIYVSFLSTFYGIWFSTLEIPLLTRNEKALFALIRCALKKRILTQKVQTSKNKNVSFVVINEIINTYGIQEAYKNLSCKRKSKSNDIYNSYLIKNLLEDRELYIDSLNNCTDSERITDILDNTFIDIQKSIDGSKQLQEIFDKERYSHFFTRIIFDMSKCELYKNFNEEIERLIYHLLFLIDHCKNSIDQQLVNDILKALIKYPAADGELWALKAFRANYSNLLFSFRRKEEYKESTHYFATICWYLVYLCQKEHLITDELKEKLKLFINEETHVVKNQKIFSWKILYKNFMSYADIKLDRLLEIFNSDLDWEYMISGIPKSVVLDHEFIIDWFFEVIINSNAIYTYNIENILNYDERTQRQIKDVLNTWFDGDRHLMRDDLAKFQGLFGYKPLYNFFSQNIELQEKWFGVKNTIQEKDLMGILTTCSSDLKQLNEEIKQKVQEKIKSLWGYEAGLDVDNDKQLYLIEKLDLGYTNKPEKKEYFVNNVAESYFSSILQELRKNLEYTLIDDCGSKSVKRILKLKPNYLKGNISEYELQKVEDKDLREKLKQQIESIQNITEKAIFPEHTFLKSNSFSFNIKFSEFEIIALTEEEINLIIKNNYVKPDGQYFFNGVYITREKLYEIISKRFAKIKIIFGMTLKQNKNEILVWDLWGFHKAEKEDGE